MVGTGDDFVRKHTFDVGSVFFQTHVNEVHRRVHGASQHIHRAHAAGHQLHFIMRELAFGLVLSVYRSVAAENDDGFIEVARLYFTGDAGDADRHVF